MMNTRKQARRMMNFGKRQVAEQVVAPVQELRTAGLTPDEVARAFAVGTAVSFLPIPAVDLLLATLLVMRWRLNKAAVMVALALWNDAVILPLYAPGLKLGRVLASTLVHLPAEPTVWQRAAVAGLQFALGNAVLAAVVTLAAYFTVRTGLSASRSTSFAFSLRLPTRLPLRVKFPSLPVTLPRLTLSGIFRSAAG